VSGNPQARILFDRDCGFCRWALGWVLRWDRAGRLAPVELQDPLAVALLEPMGEDERMGSWHLVDADGVRSSAGAAAAPLLRLLPGGRPLAALADRFPSAVERAYRRISGARSKLGPRLSSGAIARADRLIAARQAARADRRAS
jgi:predicted DCC family thiol-disulfide oxidoreductase YuxK